MTAQDTYAYASVAQLGAAYRSGETTPTAVVAAAIARAEALEPHLNAIIRLMRGEAMAAAVVATHEIGAGVDRGPLHGIPVAIKDLIDMAGLPTTSASRASTPEPAGTDAALVAHLRQAGAILFAKTNLLEFAYGIAHPAYGQTNNPWDITRTSGGSSGGSAALVGAGIVPLAVGTDTGGSIRIPASYCGIVGLKPSYGLVSTDGVMPLSWSLDHVGPMARSVDDAAALLEGLTGVPGAVPPRPLAGLRIGVITDHLDSPLVTAGVRAAVTEAMARLADAGAHLSSVGIADGEMANPALLALLLPEASLAHQAIVAARAEGYAPGTLAQVRAGFATPAVDYVRALRVRQALTERVEALFSAVDVLLGPTVAFVAPHEDPVIEGQGGDGEMLSTGLANLTGHPAISIPCGFSAGLPVGLHLIGPARGDAGLLSAARAIERELAVRGLPRLAARPASPVTAAAVRDHRR